MSFTVIYLYNILLKYAYDISLVRGILFTSFAQKFFFFNVIIVENKNIL